MKKISILVLAAVISVGAMVGCTSKDGNKAQGNTTKVENKDNKKDETKKPMAKVLVNISGEITAISEDGSKIKVGDQWVIITDETRFEDDPDNGVEPVSKDFKIGNRIAGYTADDTSKDEVVAGAIYSNVPKREESMNQGKPMGKVAVNISGEITEISEDGTKVKVNDQWVVITEETSFMDDPDNGSEPVSKELKVGNFIQGFTLDDTSNEEVKAYSIYSNGIL